MTRKAPVPAVAQVSAVAEPFSRRLGWRPVAIFALVALSYAAAVEHPLLMDDQTSIVSNESIRRLTPLTGPLSPPRDTPVAGRPLVNLTLAINYATDGIGVRPYRVTNVLIHVLVGLTLFGVLRLGLSLPGIPTRFSREATNIAFAAALLWSLHPLNSEVVDYVTQRSESLMALFYLLTIYAALRALEPSGAPRWTIIATLSAVASVMSKESAVTLPAMILLLDRVFVFSSWRDAFWQRRALYAGLALSWVVLAAILWTEPRTSVGFSAGTTWWVYLLNQAQVIPRYVRLVLWPRALVVDYGLPQPLTFADVGVGFMFVGLLGVASLAALWRAPRAGFLAVFAFATLAPTSSIVPIATEVGAERRMYLPLMAIVALVVFAAHRLLVRQESGGTEAAPRAAGEGSRRLLVPVVVLTVACVAMIGGLVLRNREYASPLTLAQTGVQRWPSGRGHFQLASELVAAGREAEALAEFREASKTYPGGLFALGTELVNAGQVSGNATQVQEGVEALLAYIKAEPEHAIVIPAREMLSTVYMNQQRYDLASEQLRALLARVPNHAGARRLMGDIRLNLNDPSGAIVEYRESLRVRPGQADTLGNLGFALAALNRFDEAEATLREVVAVVPDDANGHLLLGRVLSVLKKYEEARSEFQIAVELDPESRDARANLDSVTRLLARGAGSVPAAVAQ